jgi:hypothetical protein
VDARLSARDHAIIRSTEREVFLALILASGEVQIRIADKTTYPGHADWVEHDQVDLRNVLGGFSFIVKAGFVTGLFPASQMNHSPDWKLADGLLETILKLLPLAPDFRLY